MELLTPLDLADLPAEGKVVFTWTTLDNAALYQLNFILPNGTIVTFESANPEIARYMEAFKAGGTYQWNVSALNAAGEELCQSDFFTFTKDVSDGVGEESAPQDNGNDEGGGNTPPPPPPPSGED